MDTGLVQWIIGGMAFAILGLSGFIGKLYSDLATARKELRECQEARVAQAEEHYRELSTLKGMVEDRKRSRG